MSRRNSRSARTAQVGLNEFARRKLAALLPLLGSDKDGEALGAARAISRTLQAAGLDFHDLAKMLTGAVEAPEPERPKPPEPEPSWRETALGLLHTHSECKLCLTEWDRTFLSNLAGYYVKQPSAAQLDILDQIQLKAGRLHHAA